MKGREVEGEMLKMLFVVREIRTVLESILKSKSEGVVSENIMEAYVEELQTILGYLRQVPTDGENRRQYEKNTHPSRTSIARPSGKHHGETILESHEEERSSGQPSPLKPNDAYEIRLRDRSGRPGAQLDVSDLVELNHELSDENEYLEEKLKEAEDYIRKLDIQRTGLLKETEQLRLSPPRIQYEKDPVFFHLNVEIERLKNELTETSQFIVKNNQEFVEEIQVSLPITQRYNESIWKLQHQVETLKGSMQKATEVINEQHVTIEEMRKQNAKLHQQPSIIGYYREKRTLSRDPGHETERMEFRSSSPTTNPFSQAKDRPEITLKRRLSPQSRPT